jgi:hypothetical protein
VTAFENAKKFFHACESAYGWDACRKYVAEGATFSAQCEPLADIDTVQGYCEWMTAVVENATPGASYDLHASGFDEETNTAMFFGTYHLKHTKDGGPVPPTNKEAHATYVYCLTMDADGKIEKMVKVWNAPWTLRELGWM